MKATSIYLLFALSFIPLSLQAMEEASHENSRKRKHDDEPFDIEKYSKVEEKYFFLKFSTVSSLKEELQKFTDTQLNLHITFDNEKIDNSNEFINILTTHSNITKIILNETDSSDILPILCWLKQNSTLTSLLFTNTRFSGAALKELANIFATNTTIETLHLEDTGFSDLGLALLFNQMSKNSNLRIKTLVINNFSCKTSLSNKFGNSAAKALNGLLQNNKSIEKIDLHGALKEPILWYDFIDSIGTHEKITHLDLSGNNITFCEETAEKLRNALNNSKTFRSLDLTANENITKETCKILLRHDNKFHLKLDEDNVDSEENILPFELSREEGLNTENNGVKSLLNGNCAYFNLSFN